MLKNNRRAEILSARDDYSAFVDKDGAIRAEIAKLIGYLEANYDDLSLSRVDQQAIPPRRAAGGGSSTGCFRFTRCRRHAGRADSPGNECGTKQATPTSAIRAAC